MKYLNFRNFLWLVLTSLILFSFSSCGESYWDPHDPDNIEYPCGPSLEILTVDYHKVDVSINNFWELVVRGRLELNHRKGFIKIVPTIVYLNGDTQVAYASVDEFHVDDLDATGNHVFTIPENLIIGCENIRIDIYRAMMDENCSVIQDGNGPVYYTSPIETVTITI